MRSCPSCGRTVADTKRFCGYCGEALSEGKASTFGAKADLVQPAAEWQRECPACGRRIPKKTAKFCRFCGAFLALARLARAASGDISPAPHLQYEPEVANSWMLYAAWIPLAAGALIVLITYFATIFQSTSNVSPVPAPTASRPSGAPRQDTKSRVEAPIVKARKAGTIASAPRPAPMPSSAVNPLAPKPPTFLTSNPATALFAGLVAHYRFNGTTHDSSGYQNHATPVGNFGFSDPAVDGRSGSFGEPVYLTVSDSPSLRLQQFTLAAWVGAHRFRSYSRILVKGEVTSYYMYLDSGGRPIIGFFDGAAQHFVVAPPSVSTTRWSFVAGTYDGASLRLYLNSMPVAERAASTFPNQTDEPLIIGWRLNGTANDYFEGFLDEVKIFRRSLAASEIDILYKEAPWVPR